MDIATHTHLNELRGLLEKRVGELLAERNAARPQGIDTSTAESRDFKDLAEREFLMQINEVQVRHEFTALQEAEAALLRLDAGAYGDCVDCGEPIGLARLRRVPAATRCLACQHSFEQELTLLPTVSARPRGRGASHG